MGKNIILFFRTSFNKHMKLINDILIYKKNLSNKSIENNLTYNIHQFIEFILHFTNNNNKICKDILSTLTLYISHLLNNLQNNILNNDNTSLENISNCMKEIYYLINMPLYHNIKIIKSIKN